MSDNPAQPSDADLERAIRDLARRFLYPPTPDVASSVRARLEGTSSLSHRRRQRFQWARGLGVGALGLLFLAAVLVASPMVRAAVGSWSSLPGVRIFAGASTLKPGRLGGDLDLGQRVTLAEARSRVSFRILLPTLPGLGQPDEVYWGAYPPGGRVCLVYRARAGLPGTAETRVGMLLTEFQAKPDQVFLGKVIGWQALSLRLSVGGHPGYWIGGRHVVFGYRTVHGREFPDHARLAGNTLLWERGSLTFRLESALPERTAAHIAVSLR